MNKKLALLGAFIFAAFATAHADEPQTAVKEVNTPTIAEPTKAVVATETTGEKKDKEDCGCKH